MTTTFNLTEDLITLLRNSCVCDRLTDCEYGAAEIDPKRPYGNSYVAGDIAELLGWEFDPDDGLTHEQADAAYEIHSQTPTALQIVLKTSSFTPGEYVRERYNDWKLIS